MRKAGQVVAIVMTCFALCSAWSSCTKTEENSVGKLTEQDVKNMAPSSVTTCFLLDDSDDNKNDYGITWQALDDRLNQEKSGENFVQLVKKEGRITEENVTFDAAVKVVAKREKTFSQIYYRADVCNLESGAMYFWRCGNSLGVFSEVATLTVPQADRKKFTFMHASDTQLSGEELPETYYHKAVTYARKLANLDFVIHTGDIVQEAREEKLWSQMLDFTPLVELPVMPLSGNHDYWASHGLKDGTNETYRHYNVKIPLQITSEGMYYSFDYQNCHFIMLNSGDVDTSWWGSQMDWLKKDLAKNTAKWTILSIHEPLYSLGKYGFQTTASHYNVEQLRASVLPLIEGKVDLVLQGHDHMVQYTYPLKEGNIHSNTMTNVKKPNGMGGLVDCSQFSLNGGTMYLMSGATGNQNRNREVSASATQEVKNLFAYYLLDDDKATAYQSAGASFSNITVTEEDITVFTYGFLPDGEKAEVITAVSICK